MQLTNCNLSTCMLGRGPTIIPGLEKYVLIPTFQLMTPIEKYQRGLSVMKECSGFCVERTKSILPSGGRGVCVTSGVVPKHHVTSLYPGKDVHVIA